MIWVYCEHFWGFSCGLPEKSKVQDPPLEGGLGLSEKSKVQDPPLGGGLGHSEKSKVQQGGVQVLGCVCFNVMLVLQVRKSRAGRLSFQQSGAMLRQLDGDTATGVGRVPDH